MKMSLSETERITLLMMRGTGNNVRSYEEVAHLFNDTFPNRNPIGKSTVRKTVHRFEETGSIKDRLRSGRPKSATNDEKSLDIMQSLVEDPQTSVSKLAQAHDISKTSIHSVLRRHNFHPYKISITQELSEDDFDRRVELCNDIISRCDRNPAFVDYIIFSDEAMFELNGSVNRHNCRYWADDNPHWVTDLRTQHPQKVNVWAGLSRRGIIGPFIIPGNLNAANYLQLLRNQVVPAIENLYGDDMRHVWFQQDGAPAHYAVAVRQYLDGIFPNRWIGRRGEIEWAPRSPDLAPNDFFFWGVLKNKVYKTKLQNLQDLTIRIMDEAALITPDQIINVLRNFYERLAHCITVEGHQFEHLIK